MNTFNAQNSMIVLDNEAIGPGLSQLVFRQGLNFPRVAEPVLLATVDALAIGSGTSIGSTSLCSIALCPSGTYQVNAYLDITTACATTGSYIVNLIYTDDQGSKTVPVNIQGTGATPATGSLVLSSASNFGQAAQIVRSTGAASINYSTTAGACGSGGPMVGKLYLSLSPLQSP